MLTYSSLLCKASGPTQATPVLMRRLAISCRIADFGNPVNYAGWVDESLNMSLRTAARRAHRRTMEIRVFASFAMQGRMQLRMELFGSDM